MNKPVLGLLVAGLCLGMVEVASAQTNRAWQDRGYFNFSFAFEAESNDFAEERSFTLYEEPARLGTDTQMPSDGVLDFSGGVRVWKNLSVGIGYSVQSSTGTTDISGSLPHPVLFDQPRNFTDTVDGIDRDEAGTHLIIGWTLPLSDKLDVMVFGGPSFFRLHQEVVSGVNAAETGPPFTVVLVTPEITLRKESAWGANIGVDAMYLIAQPSRVRIGVGGFARYAAATATIQLSQDTLDTKVGGFQMGGGLRVRF